jgi:hypothetical protein
MKRLSWIILPAAALTFYVNHPACADEAPKADVQVIADFEKDSDAKLVKGGDDQVSVAIDKSHATSGEHSLKITSQKGNDYGPFDLTAEALKGWEKFKYVALDFTSDQDVAMAFSVEVWDAQSTNYQTRATQEEDLPTLKKGKVTLAIDLGKFTRNDKSGKIDLSKITKFRIIFHTKDIKDDYVTYVDNIRLTNEDPTVARPKVILDFEKDGDAKLVKGADDPVSVAIDKSHATHGESSLKVTVQKGNEFGPFDLIGAALTDMGDYKYLVMDLTSDVDAAVPVFAEVWDAQSTNYATRATQEEGLPSLKKGKTTLVIDLRNFARNDKSGKMNMAKLTKFRVILKTQDLKEDYVTYLDNVRLTNDAP